MDIPALLRSILRGGLLALGLAGMLTGCAPAETGTTPCGQATITAMTEDATNTASSLSASRCMLEITDGMLVLDLLEDAEDMTPRILFTLPDGFVPEGEISLDRAGRDLSTELPPAIYQELDATLESGPFWSSIDGRLQFAVLANGDLLVAFQFTADNPPSVDDNSAGGEVRVNGTATINRQFPTSDTCGLGLFGSTLTLLSLGFLRQRRRT